MVFGIPRPELKSMEKGPRPVEPALGGLKVTGARGSWFRFYFGEFVVSPGRRRFTALRMVFARSPLSEAIVAETEINGSEHP
jgi:hypothetical protein